jgi:hypothetical protein
MSSFMHGYDGWIRIFDVALRLRILRGREAPVRIL